MHRGYIKLWRKIRDNPRLHDPDYMAVWAWCLLEATYSPRKSMFGGKEIELKPGQFTTGRRQFSELCGVQESKLERIFICFVNNLQIEQQTSNTNRLISIINWKEYQDIEQQMNNKRTTDEQQVNTPKEVKKVKNKTYTAEFETFWSAYPKKESKATAAISFNKIPPDTLPAIIAALSWQCKLDQWKKDGGQFIPMPATYLNQRRWEDIPNNQALPKRESILSGVSRE